MDRNHEGYQKIIDLIKGKIEWGVYKPGDRVFSERELAEKYDTNRMVVKEAIQTLVEKGYLKKIHGKGTFVVKSSKHCFRTVTGFELSTRGESASYRVISKGIVPGFAEMNIKLNLASKEKLFRLQRLHLENGEPVIYQDTFIPLSFFPRIEMEDFEIISPISYMEHKGVTIANTPQRIAIERVNEREAKYLSLKPETEVLTYECLYKDTEGRIVEYTKMYCLFDRIRILSSCPL